MLFCRPTYSPGAATPGLVPPTNPVSAELPVGGGTPLCDDPHALVLPDGAEIYIRNTSHYRAKMFIPCPATRCNGRLQLRIADRYNRPLKQAFYLCENKHCLYSQEEHALFPEHMRTEHVMEASKKRHYKSDEARTRDEMETML